MNSSIPSPSTSLIQSPPYASLVASATGYPQKQVTACISLLENGSTVPFIARYRKEQTGSLDEVAIFSIQDNLEKIKHREERREVIITRISDLGKMTDTLLEKIRSAGTMAELEDLYLPYRPRKKTRADAARERGLEPLASQILLQNPQIRPLELAAGYLNHEAGIASADIALTGAQDIIAELICEDPEIRQSVRDLFRRSSHITVSAARGTGGDAGKYQEYVDFSGSAASAPSHRILALFRGEDEGLLSVKVGPDPDQGLNIINRAYVTGRSPSSDIVESAITDGYRRLLAPSLEREIRSEMKERADLTASQVFASNLRDILLTPPLGPRRVLALDPGFRTGCKLVILNPEGSPVKTTTIFPHPPQERKKEATEEILSLCREYQVEVIAIGDGTAGRETFRFIRELSLPESVIVVSVPEQGASVYSASSVARDELPDMDVSMRGAVSIGRRLIDPLAELVKIEPRSLGIGQYQHDVDQKLLEHQLQEVVRSVVNAVGVNLNTASPSLLSYVSGITVKLASAIITYREKNGLFQSREELKKVKGVGEKTFEQAAGFLRVFDGKDPLDGTGVHPERYGIVMQMAESIGADMRDLIRNESLVKKILLESFVQENCGLQTLNDIMQELVRPGRDPRGEFSVVKYDNLVTSIDDLTEGMELLGIVTNVTNFGAFVSIGIKENGLVHISEMADQFVRDPADIVRVHQQVHVRVLSVDCDRGRISLSMKQAI